MSTAPTSASKMKETSSQTLRVVAGVFFRKSKDPSKAGETELLIFRRGPNESWAGSWEFPGGKVETGESDAQALVRELEEELSVQTKVLEYVGESRHAHPTKVIVLVVYLVQAITQDKDAENASFRIVDHDQMQWVTQNEISQYEMAAADVPLIQPAFSQSSRWLTRA